MIGADEFVLSPILSPIAASFDTEPARIAFLITAYALPYALFAPVFGPLSDRLGRRRTMLPALALFIAATAVTALAPGFETAIAARVAAGIAAAAITPNVFALVGDLVAMDHRPRAMGHVQTGLTLGLIASPAVGAWVADAVSWRAAFALIAAVGLAATVAVARVVPQDRPASAKPAGGMLAVYRRALGRPGALAAALTHGLWLGVAVGTFAIVGETARLRFTLSVETVGLIIAGFGVATVLGNQLAGPLTRLVADARRTVILGIAGTGAGIAGVLLPGAPSMFSFAAALACWAVAGGFGVPAQQARLAEIGAEDRGALMALAGSAMNFGIMAVTALEGWLFASHGPQTVALAACCALAAALALTLFASTGGEDEDENAARQAQAPADGV